MKPPVEAPTSSAQTPATSQPERVQRIGQLHTPARDVLEPGRDLDLDLDTHHLPRFRGPLATRQQQHLAGDHGRRRTRPGLEQPALGQQHVEPHLGHRSPRVPQVSGDLVPVCNGREHALRDPLGRVLDFGVQQLRRAVRDVAVGKADAQDARGDPGI